MHGGFIAWVGVAFVVCAGAAADLWGVGPVVAAFTAALFLGEGAFVREE